MRPATEADLEEVARIHVAGWKSTYRGMIADSLLDALTPRDRLPLWREWWQGEGVQLRVADGDGALAGFLRRCPARPIDEPPAGYAEITHLYLDPEQIGTGLGAALLQEALEAAWEEGCSGVVLWVLEENVHARRFYERFGLAADGARHAEPRWLGEGVYEVRYAIRFA